MQVILGSLRGDLDLNLTFRSIDLIERIELLKQLQEDLRTDSRKQILHHLDQILHSPEFQALEST